MCFWMAGHLFGRHFDAEVAARDHDAIGDFEDGVEMLDGLGFLELGDDPGVGFEGGETGLDVADVVGGADEGDGDGVAALGDGELEIDLVFFGERGDVDGDAGEVDALLFAEQAAVDDFADDVFALDLDDVQLDESVGEQDAGAGLEVFSKRGEDGADALGGALDVVRGDGDVATGDELNGDAIFEAAGNGSWGPGDRRGCRSVC